MHPIKIKGQQINLCVILQSLKQNIRIRGSVQWDSTSLTATPLYCGHSFPIRQFSQTTHLYCPSPLLTYCSYSHCWPPLLSRWPFALLLFRYVYKEQRAKGERSSRFFRPLTRCASTLTPNCRPPLKAGIHRTSAPSPLLSALVGAQITLVGHFAAKEIVPPPSFGYH